ncbi:MAG: hypothetical protein LC778_17780 [Acidobacteria bacterium]|nr:hypothetical protein [Acidobacteriota bacterium]
MAQEKRQLPEGFTKSLKDLIAKLEESERREMDRVEKGEIELKISENEALWFVAYRTASSYVRDEELISKRGS